MRMIVKVIVCVLFVLQHTLPLNNGLAKTPGLGWNSWNFYHCSVNESIIMQTAKAMVTSGLSKVGYKYVNIDDCWAFSRNSSGYIQADPTTFPHGIEYVANYVHSLGLLFGIYSDAGYNTCAGRPGSLGYETQDATSYASWGVDYLKYDNCNSGTEPPQVRYPIMRDALNKTNRPIYFSLCEWGVDEPYLWAQDVGNTWRTTQDIQPTWINILNNLDLNADLYPYAAPGAFNDADMLEIGVSPDVTFVESIAHFSIWSIIKSPLIIGCDVTNMDNNTFYILTNTEVIGVNQDSLGFQARKVASFDPSIKSQANSMNNFYKKPMENALPNSGLGQVKAIPCNPSSLAQQWKVSDDGKIVTQLDGRCLFVLDCSPWSGGIVGVYDCNQSFGSTCNGSNLNWKIQNNTIISNVSSMCLDVGNPAVNGVPPMIVQYTCEDGPYQKWYLNKDNTISSGLKGLCLAVDNALEIWATPLEGTSVAVTLFNRGLNAEEMTVEWEQVFFIPPNKAFVRDLWQHKDLGVFVGNFRTTVQGHGVVMLKVTPAENN